MKSALYEGTVAHHRRHPVDHRFTYRLAMPFVHLEEMEQLCRLHPLWSNGRPNIVSYRRADFLGDATMSLDRAVRELVKDRLGTKPSGPIAMLAHPRTWGWSFNPIALYYCFDPSGTRVDALVAEVTNTPWYERHAYVVGEPGSHRFDKALHVSPFFGMDLEYEVSYQPPGACLSLRIRTTGAEGKLFDAVLHLERREATRREMGRLITAHPFLTMRLSAAIYRQAFALWRAGVPFVAHPRHRPDGAVVPRATACRTRAARSVDSKGTWGIAPDWEDTRG